MSALGRPAPWGILLSAALAGTLGPASPTARADHMGTLQLNRGRVGAYAVSAWTQPSPPRVGACLVAVAVMRPETRAPVLDVAVRVTAEPVDGAGEPVATQARRDKDPLGIRYLAELTLPRGGQWTIRIDVAGREGDGTVDFPLEVRPPLRLAWWLLAGVGAAIAGLAAVWAFRLRVVAGRSDR